MGMKSPHQIILVDDEEHFCGLLRETFREKGFSLECFFDGYSALSFLYKNSCDMILLNLQMPGMDGFEFLQRLQSLRDNVPVIVLTALPLTPVMRNQLELMTNAILKKPVRVNLILTEVQNHII